RGLAEHATAVGVEDGAADLLHLRLPGLAEHRVGARLRGARIPQRGAHLLDEIGGAATDAAKPQSLDLRNRSGNDGKAGSEVLAYLERVGTSGELVVDEGHERHVEALAERGQLFVGPPAEQVDVGGAGEGRE